MRADDKVIECKIAPMVRHANHRRFAVVANQLRLVFNFQLCPSCLIVTCRIPDSGLHCAWIAFLAVPAKIGEEYRLPPISIDGVRPIPVLRSPALLAPVQAVSFTVGAQLVCSAIEVVELGIPDPVRRSPDRFAKIGMVDGGVQCRIWETLHYVVASDPELLDGCTTGKKGDG